MSDEEPVEITAEMLIRLIKQRDDAWRALGWNSKTAPQPGSLSEAHLVKPAQSDDMARALEPFAKAWDDALTQFPNGGTLAVIGIVAGNYVSAVHYRTARNALDAYKREPKQPEPPAPLATGSGRLFPLKFSTDWLKAKIATDPDLDDTAGRDIMHSRMLDEVIKICKQREGEGDCPTVAPFSVETLENAVTQLAAELAAFRTSATILRKNFARYLAKQYVQNPQEIARLCDMELDQSGELLGYVRDYARTLEAPKQ